MNRVENIMTKGEIDRFEQFLPLSPCFQKVVCCRGVEKRQYEGKGSDYSRCFSDTDHMTWDIFLDVWKHGGKGRNYIIIFLFPLCFRLHLQQMFTYFYLQFNSHILSMQTIEKLTRNITEFDQYPQLVPDNIHMYEKFKGT